MSPDDGGTPELPSRGGAAAAMALIAVIAVAGLYAYCAPAGLERSDRELHSQRR